MGKEPSLCLIHPLTVMAFAVADNRLLLLTSCSLLKIILVDDTTSCLKCVSCFSRRLRKYTISEDILWKFTFQDVPRPSGKRSSVSESVIVGTRCHSKWLKHSLRTHSRTDSTSSGQIWARESCNCSLFSPSSLWLCDCDLFALNNH